MDRKVEFDVPIRDTGAQHKFQVEDQVASYARSNPESGGLLLVARTRVASTFRISVFLGSRWGPVHRVLSVHVNDARRRSFIQSSGSTREAVFTPLHPKRSAETGHPRSEKSLNPEALKQNP